MRRTLLFSLCITLLLAACRQQETVSQLIEINAALEKANSIINDNCKLAYEEMNGKLFDPRTHDRAKIWEHKARVIKECATNVKLKIDYLKSELIRLSDSLQNQDRAIVKKILKAYGNADKLYEKLNLLKDSVGSVFDGVEDVYRDSVYFYNNVLQIGVAGYSKADWLKRNFDNCSPLLAVMALNKIESNVLRTENNLVWHCNLNVVYNFCGYYRPAPMASLNNSVVKTGDTIMVTAGVGVFERETTPRITINGTRIKLYEDPLARYQFIVTGKPGIYNVPVTIEYLESDGSRKKSTKNLGYIIT